MFSSLGNLISDVAEIATAPVRAAVGATRIVTAPVAAVATTVAEAIEEAANEVDDLVRGDDK